eukprot:scaffold28778_cov62-Phaeocystis_antarctica.AAC.5
MYPDSGGGVACGAAVRDEARGDRRHGGGRPCGKVRVRVRVRVGLGSGSGLGLGLELATVVTEAAAHVDSSRLDRVRVGLG